MIATESGNPAQGLGIANSALEHKDALAGEPEQACAGAEKVMALAQGLGSLRDSTRTLERSSSPPASAGHDLVFP